MDLSNEEKDFLRRFRTIRDELIQRLKEDIPGFLSKDLDFRDDWIELIEEKIEELLLEARRTGIANRIAGKYLRKFKKWFNKKVLGRR